ncbi:hypothetical protein HRbin24_00540 [bacterium HR24]|nr:hypothetical protein HRbin24_00540 [bacterium HR24]
MPKPKKKQGPYATILAELAAIKRDLHNHLSFHDKEAAVLQERLEALQEAGQEAAGRLEALEAKMDRLEGGLSLLRWGIPIAISLAALLLDRLLR